MGENPNTLGAIGEKIKGLLSPTSLKTEIEIKYGKGQHEPSILLVSIWTESKNQKMNLQNLITSVQPKDWKRVKIRSQLQKDRFLWKTTVTAEFIPLVGKPLAVRLAEQGRPGQEKDPSYPT